MNLSLYANTDEQVQISLFDATGKLIIHKESRLGSGENNLLLNLDQVANGYYLLRIERKLDNENHRVLVQR